jgi:hypothetical protein
MYIAHKIKQLDDNDHIAQSATSDCSTACMRIQAAHQQFLYIRKHILQSALGWKTSATAPSNSTIMTHILPIVLIAHSIACSLAFGC